MPTSSSWCKQTQPRWGTRCPIVTSITFPTLGLRCCADGRITTWRSRPAPPLLACPPTSLLTAPLLGSRVRPLLPHSSLSGDFTLLRFRYASLLLPSPPRREALFFSRTRVLKFRGACRRLLRRLLLHCGGHEARGSPEERLLNNSRHRRALQRVSLGESK